MTLMSLFFAMNWMLNGPVTLSASAIMLPAASIFPTVCGARSWGGSTSVASPECTPAFSTCSEITCRTTLPWTATASYSISFASWMYLDTTTGWSGETAAAWLR
eukprot:Lithocolla_globosa_v1_NODE_410_length_4127_cov_7.757859.p3 type:complete len:104 gc:universal NODE_410_length_4127_cov_7.757859:1156-845(-)